MPDLSDLDRKHLLKEGLKERTKLNIDERMKFEEYLTFDKLEPPAEKVGNYKLKKLEDRLTTTIKHI